MPTEVWCEITVDTIRGDRDGLVSLRDAINDALRRGRVTTYLDDETGTLTDVIVERVGQ